MAARHGVPRNRARGDGARERSRTRDRARPRARENRTFVPRADVEDLDAPDLDAPDLDAPELDDPITSTGEHDDLDVDAIERSAGRAARRDPGRGRGRNRGRAVTMRARWAAMDTKRAVILAVVLSVVALTLAMPLRTYFSQRSEFDQLRESNQQLASQVADYQRKVNEQNDPAYIEARARERLQFVKPGETPLVMMYPDDDARKAAAEQAEERARNPWYDNLWDSIANPPNAR